MNNFKKLRPHLKCKEYTLADMIERYIKKITKQKASSEPSSQLGSTNQTHDIKHEVGMTP